VDIFNQCGETCYWKMVQFFNKFWNWTKSCDFSSTL